MGLPPFQKKFDFHVFLVHFRAQVDQMPGGKSHFPKVRLPNMLGVSDLVPQTSQMVCHGNLVKLKVNMS